MEEQYYTTHQVSKFCNVYPTTVIGWIDESILPAFTTPGGHRRVKKADLLKLMKKNSMPIPSGLKSNNKPRILVVDDNPRIIAMIKRILEAEKDFEIATAKSGFEAGTLVAGWLPDLILLDILMPEMDGFEVCKRLRQNEETKNIPIIIISVILTENALKKRCLCEADDYLSKPFKSHELVEKVRKHLKVRK